MTNELFPPITAGLILSAVLAAIMSTASSQLLVAASAFAQDFYRTLLRKDAEQKELVWISRASVLVIASLAIFLGLNPNNFILDNIPAYVPIWVANYSSVNYLKAEQPSLNIPCWQYSDKGFVGGVDVDLDIWY